jgi:hypothetical protein
MYEFIFYKKYSSVSRLVRLHFRAAKLCCDTRGHYLVCESAGMTECTVVNYNIMARSSHAIVRDGHLSLVGSLLLCIGTRLLIMPATSASVERLFSVAGQIATVAGAHVTPLEGGVAAGWRSR